MMPIIIMHKKDIIAYVDTAAAVAESKAAFGEGWDEVADVLCKEIRRAEHPPYGSDWGPWLEENIEELLDEAVSIVM
jgi:hypothetical protein